MAGYAEKCSECDAETMMIPSISHLDSCTNSAIWYHEALEIENKELRAKNEELKDRLRAAFMKPQWKRAQK